MDIESTLETVAGYLPSELDLSGLVSRAVSYLPTQIDFGTMSKFLLLFAAGSLILGVLGRIVLGKRSSLNHSVSSAIAILFIYAVTIVIYIFHPWKLDQFLSPLPFVTFFNEYMVVLPVTNLTAPVLCRELLSLIILAFLVNLLDTFIPRGKTVFSWFLLRFLSVGLSMGLHLLVHWASDTYLPNVLVTYAPMILLILLILLILMGFLNVILGITLASVNPFIGAMYSFFFSNLVGKQLTKAVFTAGILSVILYVLDVMSYTVISISAASLAAYVPFVFVCLLLWYLIGRLL